MSSIARLENVSRLFGVFAALRHVSAEFETGRCYVLLGENGAGKSTLLRILAGLLHPSYGKALIVSRDGAEDSPEAQRGRIGYMSHAPMLYDELSATENLAYFASLYRGQPCLDPGEALKSVGLDPTLQRPVGQYSQGMRQRTSLARVLISLPELLLLDEPFSNMDVGSAQKMVALLAQFRTSRRTILLTTHQRELAEPIADYFLTLQAGELVSTIEGPQRLAEAQR
jgi:heme ABC exporter ATP-binding subunit CcmA